MQPRNLRILAFFISILVVGACYLLGSRHSENPAILQPTLLFTMLYASLLTMALYPPKAGFQRPQKIIAAFSIILFVAVTIYFQLPNPAEIVGSAAVIVFFVIWFTQIMLRDHYNKETASV